MGESESAPAGRKGSGVVGNIGGSPGRVLLDHVPEMVTISDREGKIVYANPATERVSGFAPEEFAVLDPFEHMHPEDRPHCEEAFGELLRNPGSSLQIEHRVRHKDGRWRWVEGTFASLFDDPEVGGLLATVRDVTESKRAEQTLRESEERQAFLLELSDALRPLGNPVAIQETASRLLGEHLGVDRAAYGELTSDDRIMTVARDYTSPGISSVVGEYRIDDFGRFFTDPLRKGRPSVINDASTDPRISRPMYESTWGSIGVRSAITYPLVKQGRFVAAIFVHEGDARAWSAGEVSLVTEVGERTWEAVERARTEAALAESEQQYRTLFTSIDEGFCTIEVLFDEQGEAVDYRFLETNPAFVRQTGLENAVGRTVREFAPEHEAFWFKVYGRIAQTGEAIRFEHVAAALGRFYDVYAFRIGEPGENRVAIIFNDILARKQAEERLRESEEKYRTLFTTVDEGFLLGEAVRTEDAAIDFRYEVINPAYERITGIRAEDLVGRTAREALPGLGKEWYETVERVGFGGETINFEGFVAPLGKWLDTRFSPVGARGEGRLAVLFKDVTERKRVEEERERLRALEATSRAEASERRRVGRELHDRVAHTMGVAHQSLQLHAAYARSDPTRAAEKLRLATEATRTALDQTRDLSAQLARPEAEETRGGMAIALRDLLDTHVPDGVKAELSVEGDEEGVHPPLREQAYLVLREAVRNAVEHSGCRRIKVLLDVDDSELRGRVEDDGSGFDPDGDPGGGLDDRSDGKPAKRVGLRSMRERTELLGGWLDVSSEPGRGTAVEIRAPLAD